MSPGKPLPPCGPLPGWLHDAGLADLTRKCWSKETGWYVILEGQVSSSVKPRASDGLQELCGPWGTPSCHARWGQREPPQVGARPFPCASR